MEGLMTNVLQLKTDPAEDEGPDELDVLYSKYLRAQGRFHDNSLSDVAMARASDAVGRLVWEIIKCRATQHWQIERKLKVLEDALASSDLSWVDCRERMLLQSAMADLAHPGCGS
jgi:hypothetical protein